MSVTVVYDANVLYSITLRDLLVRIGQMDLVRARWTDEITNEWSRALVKRRPDLETRVPETIRLMNESIRNALVTGYKGAGPIPNASRP